jgi:hypothetical protein
MEIEAQLHRYQYSNGSKYWPIYLLGGFEVQPETIYITSTTTSGRINT